MDFQESTRCLTQEGALNEGVLVNHCKGFVVVEPVNHKLGDGNVLSRDVADYELRPVWCLDANRRLSEARRRLGLGAEVDSSVGATADI